MIRVMAAADAIFIDGYASPIPGGTLKATLSGTVVTIGNLMTGGPLVVGDWAGLADGDGNGFASAAAAMAYLDAVLAPLPGRTVEAVAAVDLAAGQLVAVDRATGRLRPARADSYPLAFVAGAMTTDVVAGFAARAGHGTVAFADWTAIAGAPHLAPGQPYFLAATGGLSIAPLAPNAVCVARVGLATSPTTLIIDPSVPILL